MSWRAQRFANRREAGIALADRLRDEPVVRATRPEAITVLGLARGGVPVAREVATGLGAALDVLVVRKIGAPGQPEFAMGAIAAGQTVVNDDIPRRLGVSDEQFRAAADREDRIRLEREERYRAGREPVALGGRTVIIVDDGLATGSTMAVALRAVLAARPDAVVIAVPTGPSDTLDRFAADPNVDAAVCVMTPEPFNAVGGSYDDFRQVDDGEVRRCLGSS